MTAINRKLFRDLLLMKGQVIAIILVIGCGVATFVMSLSTLESLRMTQQTYYERYRFAHVFASLKRAPNALGARIAAIPGVAQVQTRIVVDVTLDVADMAEPAVGRLISVPERPTSGLNALHLRSGRFLEPGRTGEVLASEAFATGHNVGPGDHVTAVINGKLETLNIVGVALSPEYVMEMGNGAAVPDDKHFGVFWIGERQLEAAFDLDGAFNSVALSLMRGASEPEVLKRLDLLIEPYGGVGAYGREDQLSNRFLTDEIRQLRGIGMVAPAIFLSVAAFLLNMVLTRVISTQREQIAALKAFGYSRYEVGMHYMLFALVVVFFGTVLGTAVGAWLGKSMTQMYSRFYRFPIFFFRFDIATGLMALGISTASALLGAFGAVQLAVRLPPAEAMRPEPPATYRKTIVETLGLAFLFSQSARMIFRQLERRPWKSSLSSFGIALATAVLVLGNFGRFHAEQDQRRERLTALRDDFERTICSGWPNAIVIGASAPRLPHTSCIAFVGLDRQALFIALDQAGVACSTGSACASGSSEPSPALVAMGLEEAVFSSALRFSFAATTTAAEVAESSRRILQVCNDLRRREQS